MASQVAKLLEGSLEYVDLATTRGAAFLLTRRVDTRSLTYRHELRRFAHDGSHLAVELTEEARGIVSGPRPDRVLLVRRQSLTLLDGKALREVGQWQSSGNIGRVVFDSNGEDVWVSETTAQNTPLPSRNASLPTARLSRINLTTWAKESINSPPLSDFSVSDTGDIAILSPPQFGGGIRNELWVRHSNTWRQLDSGLRWHSNPSFSDCGTRLAIVGTKESIPTADFPLLRLFIINIETGRLSSHERLAITHGTGRPDPGPQWFSSQVHYRHAYRGRIGLSRNDDILLDAEQQVLGFGLTSTGDIVWTEASHEHSLSLCWARSNGSVEWRWSPNVELDRWVKSIPRRERTFLSRHGTSVRAEVLGEESGKRAPLLISLHGGPHGFIGPGLAQTHFYRWLMAARGWLVVAPDFSGSATYSNEHTLRIRGRWGTIDFDEVNDIVDTLVEGQLADPDSTAVSGYSYGGYLAALLAMRTTRFRSASVGGALLDLNRWRLDADIGQTYLGWHFEEDRSGFLDRLRTASAIAPTHPSTTAVLTIGGMADTRCPPADGQRFHASLAESGCTCEWVGYPNEGHGLPGSGGIAARLDYHEQLVAWHERYGKRVR